MPVEKPLDQLVLELSSLLEKALGADERGQSAPEPAPQTNGEGPPITGTGFPLRSNPRRGAQRRRGSRSPTQLGIPAPGSSGEGASEAGRGQSAPERAAPQTNGEGPPITGTGFPLRSNPRRGARQRQGSQSPTQLGVRAPGSSEDGEEE